MTYVIAVANEKGGVAKTTTALSLGAAMVELHKKALLMDLDPQANLTLSLGLKPNDLNGTVSDVLLGSGEIPPITHETTLPGLDLAPANNGLLMAERFLGVRDNHERLLKRALRNVDGYDMVFLDCPPALGSITRLALTAADLLIIPTQCEYFSAHALQDVLEMIRDVRASTNPRLRYRLLLTMVDRRNRIHRSLYEQVRSAFGKAVFDSIIEVDTRLRESPIFAQPITLYAPSSRGAKQYRQLAKELKSYAQETVRTAA
jgi:chromosome partitioning protein